MNSPLRTMSLKEKGMDELLKELTKLVKEERRIQDKIEEWEYKSQMNSMRQKEIADEISERV